MSRMSRLLVVFGVLFVAVSVALVGSGAVGPVLPGWQVVQDCTPAAPGDTSGSVGSASLDAAATSTSLFAIDNDFTLTDATSGTFKGNVVGSPVVGSRAHLDVAGKLNFLVADRTVDPVWYNVATPLLFGEPADITNAGAAGTFASVYDIAVDPFDDSIFVLSYGSATIGATTADFYLVNKYSSAGVFISWFGGGTNGTGAPNVASGSADGFFGGASGIAVSPVDGSVAVGDGQNRRVQIFTPNGGRTLYTYSTKVGTAGSGDGQFGSTQPISLAYDSVGALYAADRGNARIQKFTISGTTVTYVAQVAVSGFASNIPIYKLAMSSTDVLHASLVINTNQNSVGTIRTYNTSLVVQDTVTIPAAVGNLGGIFNIVADSTGIWANWAATNYVVHYSISGSVATEDDRWYSGFPNAPTANTNYGLSLKTTGDVVVLLKEASSATATNYGPYRITSFGWTAVPLSDAIEGYLLECDATLGGMTYSYDAAVDPDVIFPAWSGDVWAHLKEICTAFQLEIYPDGNVIRVADIGSRTVTINNHSPLKIEPTNIFGGQQIVVYAQNPRAGGGIVFDASTQNNRFQIDVGQSATVTVNTLNYPVTVDILVPTSTLPVLPGQYYVLDSLGVNVPAATWTAAGASVTPALGDSPGQIKFTLKGPPAAISGYTGPFTFADSLSSTGTAALTLTGTGTFTTPQSYTFGTGADPTKTTQLIARTINNFAIADLTQVAGVTPAAIEDVSGVAVTVSFSMPTADLNGFGLSAGSLFYAEDSRYRIKSVRFGGLKADVTAVRHVTLNDIDTALTGLTYDQQDAIWDGYSLDDRTIKPLALTL